MTDVRQESSGSAISRMAELEREISGLRRELEHQQRLALTGTVAAGVAHEINNVLTPAVAHVHELVVAKQGRSVAEPDATSLERIAHGIESATALLQTMLDFASASDETSVAEIDASLDAAVECLGRDLAHDRIDLKRSIPARTSVAISPLSLQQVFLNLLLNARRAFGGRPGRIDVAVAPHRDDVTVITVADTGPGIPPEIFDRVFDAFVTQAVGHEGAASESGGTGLGLAVCRRSIEAAGGRICAAPGGNAGATIVIELPTASAVVSH